MKLVPADIMSTNIDPIADSVEPLAELLMDHSHLSPQQAEACARALLEFCWASDLATAERD